MSYYKIDIKGWSLTGATNAQEFIQLRRRYLKITQIFWLLRAVEIDPYYIDCTYELRTPVLIYLN
jgi:hypothetical protein